MQDIKKKLLHMREDIIKNYSQKYSNIQKVIEIDDIGDDVDLASSERERELQHILCDFDRKQLKQIDAALVSIDNNTYGICEECEEKISKPRLLAMPFTQLCLSCKEEEEKLKGKTVIYGGANSSLIKDE